jgi:putative Mg2+ transporter-C (MgtC) family protein
MSPQVLFSDPMYLDVSLRLLAALAVGGLIGLERSYHGRPAGFRTHALVCLSTSLLMLVTVFAGHWFDGVVQGRVTLDPTRMAQGIMTGIGFLGAGTIMREGFSVRGLTTAASLWITAAIGILVGVGFYFPALLATVLTLGTLSVFRWIESSLPIQFYAHLFLRFADDGALSEPEIRRLLKEHRLTAGHLSYRLDRDAEAFEYRMIIRSRRAGNANRLIEALGKIEALREFSITPTVD